MNNDEFAAWVTQWSERYNTYHDAQLHDAMGSHALDRDAFETVIDWKFARMANRRAQAHQRLSYESDQALLDLRAAARRCVDDEVAMRIIKCVAGVGLALGSALLMVMDPKRWTVMDRRAVASLRAVGYEDVPSNSMRYATWMPYLTTCRVVQQRTQLPLRTIDRALWAANGTATLPGAT